MQDFNERQLRRAFRCTNAKLCRWGYSGIASKGSHADVLLGQPSTADIVVTGVRQKTVAVRWRDYNFATGRYKNFSRVLGTFARDEYPEAAEAIERWLEE